MIADDRIAVVDIYKTDLERHLFAPAPRRRIRRSSLSPSDWLRDWLGNGWMRWKALAEARLAA